MYFCTDFYLFPMRSLRHTILILVAFLSSLTIDAQNIDYNNDATYKELRQNMSRAFNEADSANFYPALKKLQDYLLEKGDLHGYYTQRCNEIIFLMNRQKIFEAYKRARDMSQELREKELHKEMYMAYNMLGHIYRYCGNKDSAKGCFREVIMRMEQAGYYESMPPIYMNIVNVEINDNPQEAMRMLEKAIDIARQYAPERVFDIETRRTVAYYELGDTASFKEGYAAYKAGEADGRTSVHGRQLEVYNLAIQGKTEEAIALARQELGNDSYDTQEKILSKAGRWKEAYETLKHAYEENDSINGVILSNSMEGIQSELRIYDAERNASRNRTIALVVALALLATLVVGMTYIILSRRRHMRQLNNAYQHALRSDNMKTAFIKNVSHEVRTPLNIISGFAQVIADPSLDVGATERQHMAQMVQRNTRIITSLIDEMLELSSNETSGRARKEDIVKLNALLMDIIANEEDALTDTTSMLMKSELSDDFTLKTNELMLKRIVSSLVNNAVKNTTEGHIVVRASEADNQLKIIVEDTGCGIPANEAEHIFDRFVKLDKFKVGIGLGLTLSRATARNLGGDVILDTTYTNGARFIVTLPENADL